MNANVTDLVDWSVLRVVKAYGGLTRGEQREFINSLGPPPSKEQVIADLRAAEAKHGKSMQTVLREMIDTGLLDDDDVADMRQTIRTLDEWTSG